ncbi:MAG: membrane protein insertase YidC [Alphaproteobacteria bacterium]
MGDNRNMLLAIVLSMAILFGWQYFIEGPKLEAEQARQQAIEESRAKAGVTDNGTGIAAGPSVGQGVDLGGAPALKSRPDMLGQSARVAITNARLSGSIALTGARFDDLSLKGYTEDLEDGSPNIDLLNPEGSANPYLAEFGWIAAQGEAAKLPSGKSNWAVDGNATLTPNAPVTLKWTNDTGLTFTRKIELDANYLFTVTDTVTNAGGNAATLYPYGLIRRVGTPETTGFYILHEGLYGVLNETLQEVDYDDLQDDGPVNANTTGGWLGITDKYWLAALVPDQQEQVAARFTHSLKAGRDAYQADFRGQARVIQPGASQSVTHRFFAGAKEVNLVDAYAEDQGIQRFDLAIDWGWFYFLTKPLFLAMDFFYGVVGNFGIAIILVTLIIKILFFPLANKSYESMSRMKKVAPELTKIRERFADDKQKQQQEMMELYKREKVNPASGCLPMIVQIPVFFALYKVLFVSIEMRHAPFFGWIQDLSAPDPLLIFNLFGLIPWDPPSFLAIGIWPLFMGASMFLQQKMNPPPPDPIQARMFMLMPIFFTFLLGSFPAGLVIYWTFNNLLSIAQQYAIMRRMGVPIGGGSTDTAK